MADRGRVVEMSRGQHVGRGKNRAKASGVEEDKGPTEGEESCTRAGK